jgi:hypothetical protein
MRRGILGRAVRLTGALGLIASAATAQTSAPAQGAPGAGPPPGQAPPGQAPPPYQQQSGYPPPPGYGYPPPPGYGYPPPPGYYGAPPRQPPPKWEEGDPVPAGYHVEEKTRTGLIIAGAITLGVPYVIGLSFASSSNFYNASGWLVVPALGPWLTLALRENRCNQTTTNELVDCVADPLIRVYLVIDGLAQTAGAILLVLGATSKRTRLVPDSAITVSPVRIGTGYGLGLRATF